MTRKHNELQGQRQSVLLNFKNYEYKSNLPTQAVTKQAHIYGMCSLDNNHLSLESLSIHHRSEKMFLLHTALQRPPPSQATSQEFGGGKVHDCGVN
ncbi:hypothetical protein CEXT_431871 [Caerostris extrusa]|uniref:Uncharacterized protein n=1 Tax=Caerostris extrusa TaxID=172846 RepID=A0AAV4TGK5_CAEEX|nr:hypothetical protein CEXT_431871 [Caerostris extrusa]